MPLLTETGGGEGEDDKSRRPEPKRPAELAITNSENAAGFLIADTIISVENDTERLEGAINDLLGAEGEKHVEAIIRTSLSIPNRLTFPNGTFVNMSTTGITPISLRQDMIRALDKYLSAPEIEKAHFLEQHPLPHNP